MKEVFVVPLNAKIERSEITKTSSAKNIYVFCDGILKIEQRKKENAKVKFKQIFFVARRKTTI